ncbi:MAG: AbrB/MazE/SpoVT family DNA-binding domain-containing protein [Candidatus Altiarchaeota archaeon]
MDFVTVSPKFQVVIPKGIREHLDLKPGEKMVVVERGRTLHFVPVGEMKDLRGFAKGLDTKNLRDESDRFD